MRGGRINWQMNMFGMNCQMPPKKKFLKTNFPPLFGHIFLHISNVFQPISCQDCQQNDGTFIHLTFYLGIPGRNPRGLDVRSHGRRPDLFVPHKNATGFNPFHF
jgi:hypothetical protein